VIGLATVPFLFFCRGLTITICNFQPFLLVSSLIEFTFVSLLAFSSTCIGLRPARRHFRQAHTPLLNAYVPVTN
jgi:hypothetical protein